MTYSGDIWRNPSDLSCFKACTSCFRCEDKGKYAKCNRCSGRHDPEMERDPYDIDDKCRCTEGILQLRTKDGRFIKTKFPHDPFDGNVKTDAVSQDEQDWNDYLYEMRSKYDDPDWDPIQFEDGSSVSNWTEEKRQGGA